jgi:hypothetical protein
MTCAICGCGWCWHCGALGGYEHFMPGSFWGCGASLGGDRTTLGGIQLFLVKILWILAFLAFYYVAAMIIVNYYFLAILPTLCCMGSFNILVIRHLKDYGPFVLILAPISVTLYVEFKKIGPTL